jgi:outer membrane receptor protein involved in Fe transport
MRAWINVVIGGVTLFPMAVASAQTPAAPETVRVGEELRLVYSVNRTPERPFDTGRAAQVITAEDIWRKNPRTLSELLMEEAGTFIQQTYYAGGTPTVRGLMGKQIIILVDGVRFNNATFPFGGSQYLNTIDLSSIERIEITRGVESVLSSDSLGGLINIILKKGPAAGSTQAFGGSVSGRIATADNGGAFHGEVSGKLNRFRYSFGSTFRSADDVIAGAGAGRQVDNAYSEKAAAMSGAYAISSARTLSMRYHMLEQDEVGLGVGDGRHATTTLLMMDPQRMNLLTVDYQDLTKYRFFDQIQLTTYVNRQEEGQIEVRSTASEIERRNFDSDRMYGASLQLASYVGQSHRLLYGFDFTTESVRSMRNDVNVVTGAATSSRGRYTDNSSYQTSAVYVQDRFDFGKWITTSIGARHGRTRASGTEDSGVATLDLRSSQDGLTGSVGVVGHLSPAINVVANLTRGFRAPTIDDLSRYDERQEGTEVPNPALEPEHSLTYEFGGKFDSPRFQGSAFYYDIKLTGLHDRRLGSWNGLSFFDLNGNQVREVNEPNVLQRMNVGRARVRGVELDGEYHLKPTFALVGNYSVTHGQDLVLNEPMSRIPPAFGKLAVRWSRDASSWRPWSDFTYAFATAQRRVSARDATDARIGANGTDGWHVFHVRGGLDLSPQLRVSFGVENILNKAYKHHGSGVYRPGRQFVLGTQLRF